jgi:protein-S-isoprenylcysteine O-methyltransferase Ste14
VIQSHAEVVADTRAAAHHRRFRWRGGIGTAILVPAALMTLFSHPVLPSGSWWHIGLRSAAWVVFLAGACLRFWGTLYLGGHKEDTLVVVGPYSIVRHPLYVGSLLIGLAAGLFLESIIFELAVVVVAMTYASATVPVEEGVLRARHGEAFEAYAARVGRFWPDWSGFHTPARITVDVHSLRLECSRASRWGWIPLIGTAVTFLRGQPWWPHLFRAIW